MVRRKRKKSKQTIRLEASWDFSDNDIDISFERDLDKVVKKHGGKEFGSGAGFGKRDVSYGDFKSLADAAIAKELMVKAIKASGRKGVETSVIVETEES